MLTELPIEIFWEICEYLPLDSVGGLRLVTKRLKEWVDELMERKLPKDTPKKLTYYPEDETWVMAPPHLLLCDLKRRRQYIPDWMFTEDVVFPKIVFDMLEGNIFEFDAMPPPEIADARKVGKCYLPANVKDFFWDLMCTYLQQTKNCDDLKGILYEGWLINDTGSKFHKMLFQIHLFKFATIVKMYEYIRVYSFRPSVRVDNFAKMIKGVRYRRMFGDFIFY